MILFDATPSPFTMRCTIVEPYPARGEGAYALAPPAARLEAHRVRAARSTLPWQIHHPLDRAPRPCRDRGIDHDLFPEMD